MEIRLLHITRIFHRFMLGIGKVEPEGWPFRSGSSFSKVQITGLPEGSTFPILTNDPLIDYFSCLSTWIWCPNSTFSTLLRRMTLCCYAALLRYIAKPEVVHALRWKIRFFLHWQMNGFPYPIGKKSNYETYPLTLMTPVAPLPLLSTVNRGLVTE